MRRIERIRIVLILTTAIACAIIFPRIVRSENQEIRTNYIRTLEEWGAIQEMKDSVLVYRTRWEIERQTLEALTYFSRKGYDIKLYTL